ncbi:semialdehyde dehydrogenase, partial [Paracoccus liaowanqingii]
MTKVALLGAGGKMGVRLATNLAISDFEVAHVEIGEAGRARLKAELGIDCIDRDAALQGAGVVILAVPDTVIRAVAAQIVPTLA